MKTLIITVLFGVIIFAGCSSLVLKPGDFAWPIESVIKVDSKGFITDDRYNFSVNVRELIFAETQDSANVSKVTLRLIRDTRGFYFVTASKFKNVYVFEQIDGGLKLATKILVAQNGLNNPALNQRAPNIQLLDGNSAPILLSKDGIAEGVKK